MADIPEDPTIGALIGHRGSGENPQPSERDLVKQVLEKLTPEQVFSAADRLPVRSSSIDRTRSLDNDTEQ